MESPRKTLLWDSLSRTMSAEGSSFAQEEADKTLGRSEREISPSLPIRDDPLSPDSPGVLLSTRGSMDVAMGVECLLSNAPSKSSILKGRIGGEDPVYMGPLRPDDVANELVEFLIEDLFGDKSDTQGFGDKYETEGQEQDPWQGSVVYNSSQLTECKNAPPLDLLELPVSPQVPCPSPNYKIKDTVLGGVGRFEGISSANPMLSSAQSWARMPKYQVYDSCSHASRDLRLKREGSSCTEGWLDSPSSCIKPEPMENDFLNGSSRNHSSQATGVREVIGGTEVKASPDSRPSSSKRGREGSNRTRVMSLSTKQKTGLNKSSILGKTARSLGRSIMGDYSKLTSRWPGRISRSFKPSENRPLNTSMHADRYVRSIHILRESGIPYHAPGDTVGSFFTLNNGGYEQDPLIGYNSPKEGDIFMTKGNFKVEGNNKVFRYQERARSCDSLSIKLRRDSISSGVGQGIGPIKQGVPLGPIVERAAAYTTISLCGSKKNIPSLTKRSFHHYKDTTKQESSRRAPCLKIRLGEEILDWEGYEGASTYYEESGKGNTWYHLDPI